MDSWHAFAAVFGPLTGSEVAPMLFKALLRWPPTLIPSRRKGRRKRAGFAKLMSNLQAPSRRHSPDASNARSGSARRVTRRPTAGPRPRRPQCLKTPIFGSASGRERESFQRGRPRSDRASSDWRYHDFLRHWPGTEHGNDCAAANAPTFESDGRALAGPRRERWHQSRSIA